VAAHRAKVQSLGSGRRPAEERQIALPAAVHPLGTLINSWMSLVRPVAQPARASLARHEGVVQRPISCKAEGHNSQRELSVVLP
jgi:hypothetical protein